MSDYTEDHLVEQPAIQLMQHGLGWEVVKFNLSDKRFTLNDTGWLMSNEPELLVAPDVSKGCLMSDLNQ